MWRVQYNTLEEKQEVMEIYEDERIEQIGEEQIIEGNFLVFEKKATINPSFVNPSQEEILGQEITNLKISNIQKDLIINQLGQEVTNINLQLIGGRK